MGSHRHRLHLRNQQLIQARRDPVTGLLSRAGWQHFAERALPHSAVVGMLDLDGFKQTNDTYGHTAADTVLATIATRLATTMGSSALVGRFGGDELVFLATREDLLEPARADDLLARLTVPIDGFPQMRVGVSLGVARLTDLPTQPAQLIEALKAADTAMYAAKTRGGGWWRYDPHTQPIPTVDAISTRPASRLRDAPVSPSARDHRAVPAAFRPR